MKNLFEVIVHIKKNGRLPSVRKRIIGCSREGTKSKIYKLFHLIADEQIDNDGRLKRRLRTEEEESSKSSFSNLKKRLYNEVLDALSIDIVQVENKQSFFEMRIAATEHLRNGYTLWQQSLHGMALDEFKSALEFADQSLDPYMLAHIRHQIMVLSSFNTETLPDLLKQHTEINQSFEYMPFLNNLCMLYYKVRYAEHFAATENEIQTLYAEVLAEYKKMEAQTKNIWMRLWVLGNMVHYYEKLEMHNELRKTIKKYLDLSEPLLESASKDFVAKRKLLEAKYHKLNNNYIEANKILNDENLKEFASNNKNSVVSKLKRSQQFRSRNAVDTRSVF